MLDKLIVLLLVGLALFDASPESAAVAAPVENRASGSAAGRTTPIEIEARLSEDAVTENLTLHYDLASDDADAATGVTRSLDDLGSLRGASAKEIEDLIPKDFVKSQVRKGDGFRYADPARRGDQIRIMRGDPGATDPLHQGPYAVISRSGNVTRIPLEGNPTLP